MKIYISHSSSHDYDSELYRPIKRSSLYKEHQIFLPHESQNIDVNLKDILSDIDLVVAEVSYASTGQGIELGRADSVGIPILCFHKSGSHPSSSLRFLTNELYSYNTVEELIDAVEDHVSQAE